MHEQAWDLYVDDMKNKKSETLAALHYNNRYIQENQCYRCHSDYGVWGTVEARGRGLSHLYHWVTNSATARGEGQIKLYGTYQNSLCLSCHSGSQKFLEAQVEEVKIHKAIAKELLGKDSDTGAPTMSCLICHSPAHPALEIKPTAAK